MNLLRHLLRRVKREPVVLGGVLLAVGQVLAESPDWKTAVPVLVSVVIRQFVSPVSA